VSSFLYRVGRFAARHRFVVALVWLGVVASVVIVVSTVGARTNNNLTLPGTGSQKATNLLAQRFPPQQYGTSPIVFSVDSGSLLHPRNKRAIDASFRAIKRAPHVYSATNPVSSTGQTAGLLSDDRRTAFIPVLLDVGSGEITVEIADRVLAGAEPARRAGMKVAAGGPIGSELSEPDTESSERVGIVAAMVILTLVFGSLVAMGMPIITAVIGLTVALGLIGLLGHVVDVPTVGDTLATMIGLGVGIDYSLFLVTKHKDQLAQGMEIRESIARAVATSGSAIVFAGSTVFMALVSLMVAGIPLVSSLGYSSAVAVLTAVLAAVTLLPALLSIAGKGIDWFRIPRFLRPSMKRSGEGMWSRWAQWIARRPWAAVAVALVILIPLTIPLFSLELGQEDIGATPKSTTERQAYDLMTEGFGVGYNGPLLIATELDPVATPSASFQRRFDRAKRLQRELKREQRSLKRQQAKLERRQADLERQQAELERQQAELEEKAAELEREEARIEGERVRLEGEQARIRAKASRLAAKARPLIARLAVILVRERVLERRIEQATDPGVIARLERRLARVRAREHQVRRQLAPLRRKAEALARQEEALLAQASRLESEAQSLQAQGDRLQAQGDRLQAQGEELKREGAALKRQAAQLKKEGHRAKKQERQAKTLQKQLTRELTKAGGDHRGTDPRIVSLQDGLGGARGVNVVSPPQINKAGDAATLSVIAVTSPASEATADLVVRLRASVIPRATAEGGITAFVGGYTASYVDLASKIADKLPVVIATVIALSFVLLMLAFRSLLVPVQAALTNLLSVAAAFGVLTATFQWGWGVELIGLDTPTGSVPIASYVPLMMFAVLFGLSMDYEVFFMSQVQQHHAEGEDPRAAIPSGLASSARVITAAAIIMISVFGSFILNGDPTVKQFGVGLASAVALAATMVLLLAPAVLVLFGKAVWWLPRFLDRLLPHMNLEGPQPATAVKVPAGADEPIGAGSPRPGRDG
jgi:uncharacterized membrane protein YdfJ with MMPL/SSD domain/peptidoglycan hydrolase CwlO-like protein